MITATHKLTGEQVEFDIKNLNDLIEAWRMAQEYEKLAKDLKDKLKGELDKYLNDSGNSEEVNGYQFKTTPVTKKNYDKSTLRQVFDEDLLDLFLEPNKTKIDKYIKEHLSELGEDSGRLRDTMIESNSWTVTRLEKLV